MLSFQMVNSGRAVQVYCDEKGMRDLIAALEKIKSSGGHAHLCSPSNGGRELDEKTPHGDPAIGEIIATWVG